MNPTLLGEITSGVDRVRSAIAQASRRTGMDFGYLYKQARIESGLRPDAKARTSSATGLYQFIDQSWLAALKRHGAKHGLQWRSEEHTSELQSLMRNSYAGFGLQKNNKE